MNTNDLLGALHLQNNITEIKFRHLAGKGTKFQDLLRVQRIETFLNWLNKNNIKIHYIALNYIYYSLVDIIDAAMSQYPFYNHELDLLLKNALYEIVKQDIDYFVNMLYKYQYPNIQDTKGFMTEFLPFVESYQFRTSVDDEFIMEYLRQVIKAASRQDNLDFFQGDESFIIFKDLLPIYLSETIKFFKAEKIFDEEQSISKIEKIVQSGVKFVDSKDEIFIQLSDVIVGLISRYYSFLEEVEDIEETIHNFTEGQQATLGKWLALLVRSSQFNRLFDAYIGGRRALDNHNKLCDSLYAYEGNS